MSDFSTINSDLIRGHIDTIILKSLFEGDRYGYDIIKEIEQKTGGKYKIKQPTLYSCLKRLEEQGFTRSYWGAKAVGGRKKYYTLTDMGRELFLKNRTDWVHSRAIIDRLVTDMVSPAFNAFVSGSTHISDRKITTTITETFTETLESRTDNGSVRRSSFEHGANAESNVLNLDESNSQTEGFADICAEDNFAASADFVESDRAAAGDELAAMQHYDNFAESEERDNPAQERYDNFPVNCNDSCNDGEYANAEHYDNFSDNATAGAEAGSAVDSEAEDSDKTGWYFDASRHFDNFEADEERGQNGFLNDESRYDNFEDEGRGCLAAFKNESEDEDEYYAQRFDNFSDEFVDEDDENGDGLDDDENDDIFPDRYNDGIVAGDKTADEQENNDSNNIIYNVAEDDYGTYDDTTGGGNNENGPTCSNNNENYESDGNDAVELDAVQTDAVDGASKQVGVQTSFFDSAFTVLDSPNPRYQEHRPFNDVNTYELSSGDGREKDDYYGDIYNPQTDKNDENSAPLAEQDDNLDLLNSGVTNSAENTYDAAEGAENSENDIYNNSNADGFRAEDSGATRELSADDIYTDTGDCSGFGDGQDRQNEQDGAIFLDEQIIDCFESGQDGTDNSPLFDEFEFSGSTYELKPGTDILEETKISQSRTGTQVDSESYYFDAKDKHSYVDEMENTEYKPSAIIHKEYADTCVYDDEELPYEEHVKREYPAEKDDAVELAPVETAHGGGGGSYGLNDGDGGAGAGHGYDVAELGSPTQADEETDGDNKKGDESFSQFLKYESGASLKLSDSDIVARDYHAALSKLVREQKQRYSEDPTQQTKLEKTATITKQMGDDVVIRRHTDSLKQHHSENYYYSNRLRLSHFMIVFLIMLVETVGSFVIFEFGIHDGLITLTDRWIYIIGACVAFVLPLSAFLMSAINYNKRKRINFEFRSSFYFRFVVCVLVMLIAFIVNIYFGILHGKFTDYLTSLFYPIILATNIVFGLFVFKILLDSKKYHCQ